MTHHQITSGQIPYLAGARITGNEGGSARVIVADDGSRPVPSSWVIEEGAASARRIPWWDAEGRGVESMDRFRLDEHDPATSGCIAAIHAARCAR